MPGLVTRCTNFPLDPSGTTALKPPCGRGKQVSQHALLSLTSRKSVTLKSMGTAGIFFPRPPNFDIYKEVKKETRNLLTTAVDKNGN